MSTSTPFLLNERHRKFVQGETRRPASGVVYRILGVCLFTVALLPPSSANWRGRKPDELVHER